MIKKTKKKCGGPKKRRQKNYGTAKMERERLQGKPFGSGRKKKAQTALGSEVEKARAWLARIIKNGTYTNSDDYPRAAED